MHDFPNTPCMEYMMADQFGLTDPSSWVFVGQAGGPKNCLKLDIALALPMTDVQATT